MSQSKKKNVESLSHLVEVPIRPVLDELNGDVGSIGDSRESQSPYTDGDTPLGALSLVVGNSELVGPVGFVEVLKRVRVGDGGDLDSDCERE